MARCFGNFQKLQFVLNSLVFVPAAFLVLGSVFILRVPKHRCAVPGLLNDTYQIQSEQHARVVDLFVPKTVSSNGETEYSSCELYSNVRHDGSEYFGLGIRNGIDPFGIDRNRSEYLTSSPSQDNDTDSCSAFVFDRSVFTQTAASQLGLVCGQTLIRSHLVMALMSGQMLGCLIIGPVADIFGRKKILVISLGLHLIVSVTIAFAVNVLMFGALYFVNGVIIACLCCSAYTLAMELVGQKWRHVAGIMLFSFWTLGMAIMALLAFLIRDWTHLQLALSCPIVLYLSYYFLAPESTRWLQAKGRIDEAKKTLGKAATVNGIKLDTDFIEKLDIDKGVKEESILTIFKYPPLVGRLGVVYVNWFVCSLTYYGLSLNVGQMSGNIFINFFLSAVFEFLGYATMSLILMKVGRKTLYCASVIFAGSVCLLTVFPVLFGDESTLWTVRVLANLGKFGISCAFGIIWMFTSELFPTSFRASVMGTSSFCARVGGVSASYIAFLDVDGQFQRVMPQIVFGIGGLVVGMLAWILPETRHKHLPQCIQEANSLNIRSSPDDKGKGVNVNPSSAPLMDDVTI